MERCKLTPPNNVPDDIENGVDVAVINSGSRLLFGKIVKPRRDHLSLKHLVEFVSYPKPKKKYLSDS